MEEILFSALLFLTAVSNGIFSYFYSRFNLVYIALLTAFTAAAIGYWPLGILLVLPLALYKRMDYSAFAASNMFAALGLSFFLLNLISAYSADFFWIAVISMIFICLMAVKGIFERRIKEFLLISSAVQVMFVMLDLCIGKITGHIGLMGTIHVFNYTFAGLALFLSVGVFARNKTLVNELEGSAFTDQWNDAFATIACLSLAGLPAFNMFVSKWALFTSAYAVTPAITLLSIFITLMLFIMYYKLVYVLLVGQGKKHYSPRAVTAVNGFFGVSCVLLGIIPYAQWWLLGSV